MKLPTLIRRRRKELHLTQDQVAQRAGISKPYLSNIETGRLKNPPSPTVLRSLERVLDFPAGRLVRLAQFQRTPEEIRRRHEALQSQLEHLRNVVRAFLRARQAGEAEFPVPPETLSLDAVEMSESEDTLSGGSAIPLLNRLGEEYPAGDLAERAERAEEFVRCPDLHDARAFAIRVYGDAMEPKYRSGDVVVISPATAARAGDDCFVRLADGETLFLRYYPEEGGTVRLQPLHDAHRPRICSAERIAALWPAVYRIERLRESGFAADAAGG